MSAAVNTSSSSGCLVVPGTGDEGASDVSASSQDVSISAQPGRDSPIAVPMTAVTSGAVQDDTDPITIMTDEETELMWDNTLGQIQARGSSTRKSLAFV